MIRYFEDLTHLLRNVVLALNEVQKLNERHILESVAVSVLIS